MSNLKEYQKFLIMVGIFLFIYLLPVFNPNVQKAILESVILLNDLCAEACSLLPHTRFLHRRSYRCFCKPGFSDEIFGSKSEEMAGLHP